MRNKEVKMRPLTIRLLAGEVTTVKKTLYNDDVSYLIDQGGNVVGIQFRDYFSC